ncbi:MAG: trypsin-like peptidase domain-containing protein, partial [bacterium]|nr:trypsin-like peptidase domain-containing protein [bacterium]
MKKVKEIYKNATPPSEELEHIGIGELLEALTSKSRLRSRGVWGDDERMDLCEIIKKKKEAVIKNTESVAVICLRGGIHDNGNGSSTLCTNAYKDYIKLCGCEPFIDQRQLSGQMCTGFLVKDDVIATAGHFAYKKNVKELCIAFGYAMPVLGEEKTCLPEENIYYGEEIIERVCDEKGDDWALVRLNRKVKDRPVLTFSSKSTCVESPVYLLGYPMGLPLKYAPGAYVADMKEAFFKADLDVFQGNSGSPVFCSESNEVVGIVSRGDNGDFRWTGHCYASVVYPSPHAPQDRRERRLSGDTDRLELNGSSNEG